MKEKTKKQTVLMAMSGGVDSSVAAALLLEQGFAVIGIFMRFWHEQKLEDESGNKCCSLDSFNDARRVAQKLGFPIYTINLEDDFKAAVVDDFLAGYARGETPNPCVQCNKHIKFGPLIRKADELGAAFVATGHYAKLKSNSDGIELWRPKDKLKDQTYFLYTLDQDKLRRLIFPLSGLTKAQVRNSAEKYELKVATKPESQEICFVPEKSHNDFLKRNLKLQPGKILSLSGEFLGEHQGLPLYTVGQRRGLEIGGTGPYYAVRFDWNNNILYVSSKLEDDALFKITLQVRDLSWIGKKPKKSFSCLASIRYRQEAEKAKVVIDKDQVGVIFAKPQRAITPGQSIVFYHGNRLLGGGIIDRVE